MQHIGALKVVGFGHPQVMQVTVADVAAHPPIMPTKTFQTPKPALFCEKVVAQATPIVLTTRLH